MKKFAAAIAIFFLGVSGLIAQENADAIVGVWETDANDARMHVFKKDNRYYGKLLWGKKVVEADGETSKKDLMNPDQKQRAKNILGMIILSGLKFDDGEYVDGTIYDPPSGKTYACKAWLKGGKLHLRGFVGFSLLGQTAVWHKP